MEPLRVRVQEIVSSELRCFTLEPPKKIHDKEQAIVNRIMGLFAIAKPSGKKG